MGPKLDGLSWNMLLKWMIWGYIHFRKPPHIQSFPRITTWIEIVECWDPTYCMKEMLL